MEEPNKIALLEQQLSIYNQNILELKTITQDQEKRLQLLERSKEKTDFQYEQIMNTLTKLNDETIPNLTAQLEELKNKPVKRYDQVVTGIISALVAGIVGFMVAKIFK